MTDNHLFKRKVYALGETVLDLISLPAKGIQVSGDGLTMQAIAGGSVLNASVSLGRMGVNVNLISEIGADKAGDLIIDFLEKNSVETGSCIRHFGHKTSLALAFLDKDKNATYSFYHDSPAQLIETNIPDFQKEDILLFGSSYSVKSDRRVFLQQVLQKAVENGSVLYYDLNIRKAHARNINELFPSYLNNIAAATIVKGSDEDFFALFGLSDTEAVYERVRPYCEILIITNGSKPVQVFTPKYRRSYKVPFITPVSTIGAGDNFNAGFIFGLLNSGFDVQHLLEVSGIEMDKMIGCGLAFATEACLSADNYIRGIFKPDFWKKYI